MQPINSLDLETVRGGLTDAERDEVRAEIRAEIDQQAKYEEKDRFRDFEKHHRLDALLCQGDYNCLRRAGAR